MESGVSPWPVVETTKMTASSCGNKLCVQTKQESNIPSKPSEKILQLSLKKNIFATPNDEKKKKNEITHRFHLITYRIILVYREKVEGAGSPFSFARKSFSCVQCIAGLRGIKYEQFTHAFHLQLHEPNSASS